MNTTPNDNEDAPGHSVSMGRTANASRAYIELASTGHANWTSITQAGTAADPALMPVEQFYDELARHDWHYCFSDDPRAYRNGTANEGRLKAISERGGDDYKALLAAFSKHYSTGNPWNNRQWAKPQRPVNGVVVIPQAPEPDPEPQLPLFSHPEDEAQDMVFHETSAEKTVLSPPTAPEQKMDYPFLQWIPRVFHDLIRRVIH